MRIGEFFLYEKGFRKREKNDLKQKIIGSYYVAYFLGSKHPKSIENIFKKLDEEEKKIIKKISKEKIKEIDRKLNNGELYIPKND